MTRLALALGTMAVALLATRAQSGDAKGKAMTPKDLVGVYRITAGEHAGKDVPQKDLQADRVTFTEDAVTVVDKAAKKVYAASYKLEAGAGGTRIHMIAIEPKKGEAAEGLIKRDGDTVTLVYALPGGKAPTEFKTHEKQMLFTLKKLQKAP